MKLQLINPELVNPEELINDLNHLDIVEIAYFPSKETPFQVDIPPTTPNFTNYQGYLDGAENAGIGAKQVWPYTRGNGVRVTQIEWLTTQNHEDLPVLNENLCGPDVFSDYEDYLNRKIHGTAVAGILTGENNQYGITGVASDINYCFEPMCVELDGEAHFIDFADALINAINSSNPGDIINVSAGIRDISITGAPCYPKCDVPYEYNQASYDAIRLAVASDRAVVLAVGNTELNLDIVDGRIFDRNYRDSGAFFVGAGTPDNNHAAYIDSVWGSNYGKRLDFQAWGSNVATTGGNGNLFNPNDDRQRYTSNFNGTSAAAPQVAGAVALVQSCFKNYLGYYLKPFVMRALLKNTGTPQGINSSTRPIGPMPNLEEVINCQFPLSDIKPDGYNHEIHVKSWERVNIAYSLNPQDFDSAPADWWLVGCYDGACFFLDQQSNWTQNTVPVRTDPLENTNMSVYNGTLSSGDWTFYFGVDIFQDSLLTGNQLFFDYIVIHVN